MSRIPKYVIELLHRRRKLSNELNTVCSKIDDYCEKIGVDFTDPDACLMTDVRIYCEVDGAFNSTLSVIQKTLDKNDSDKPS